MSDTTLQRFVQPKHISELEQSRIEFFNFRLNEHGRKIVSRMNSDNDHTLLTQPGYIIGRNIGTVKLIVSEVLDTKNSQIQTKTQTKIDKHATELYFQEKFYTLVDMRKYSDAVASFYSEPAAISWRSVFESKAYFEVLNSYGRNREHEIDPITCRQIVAILEEYMKPWCSNTIHDFSLLEFLQTGKWLTHIKTGSNSGYPDNVKQTKDIMATAGTVALKFFNDWKLGKRIEWKKLAFEMGYRTERKHKHRVVCMAAKYEKPISAVISTILDLTAIYLPFNLPRKFGNFTNTASKIFETNGGRLFSKDFDGFDTSIPLSFIRLLRDWFKTIGNTFCDLIAFECDIILHSWMIVGPNKAFWIAALPSGIGITQFIGSLIHWLIDKVVGLESSFSSYQSDDNICITTLDDTELGKALEQITARFKMTLSPLGKKSFIDETYNKFLQKVIDRKKKVYFNQEQRAFTNAIFRERELTDDTLFEQLFDIKGNDKEGASKKKCLAYLGNLVSFGQFAPSFPEILGFLYGRKQTGFTTTQIKWGLTNLEKYMQDFLEREQHRPLEQAGFVTGIFENLLENKGWVKITAKDVEMAYSNLNLKTYAQV